MTELEPQNDQSKVSKAIAHILDDLIKIPGTDKRIGLDPIIGLFPGIGDTLTSAAGLALLATAARRKIPNSVYLRMASNWSLNAIVGAIPFAGDAFSFWFKSNRRNYDLMAAYAGQGQLDKPGKESWVPFGILVGAIIIVTSVIGAVLYALLKIAG